MARLIAAKELERQIKEAFEDSNPVLMGQMLRWIRKQPKVDAVEVVRCKDCQHCDIFQGETTAETMMMCMIHSFEMVEPTDFCSYGERKCNG